MGLSFKKSVCLRFHTKSMFKIDNTVNDPFSLINITGCRFGVSPVNNPDPDPNMLQSLKSPVVQFSPNMHSCGKIFCNCKSTLNFMIDNFLLEPRFSRAIKRICDDFGPNVSTVSNVNQRRQPMKATLRNDGWFPIIFLRDNCLQNCHLGRQIVDLMDRNFVLRRCEKAICDHKTNEFLPIMIIFNRIVLILKHFLLIFV